MLITVAIAAVFAVVLYRMSGFTSSSFFGRNFDSTNYRTFAIPAMAAGINLVGFLIFHKCLVINFYLIFFKNTSSFSGFHFNFKLYL